MNRIAAQRADAGIKIHVSFATKYDDLIPTKLHVYHGNSFEKKSVP